MRLPVLALILVCSLSPLYGQKLEPLQELTHLAFRSALSNIVHVNDSAGLKTLFDRHVDSEWLFSFEQQVLFHLALKEYDELNAWLPTAIPRDHNNRYLSFYADLRKGMKPRDREAWFNQFIHAIEGNFTDPEIRDLLLLCITHERLLAGRTNAAFHARYNRMVIQFMENYPHSRFRAYVGTTLNAEHEEKGMGFYADLGAGAFVQTNTTEEAPVNYWEAPYANFKMGLEFKKNVFSFWMLRAAMDEFPETVNNQGPFNELFTLNTVLRYDRLLFESKRVDLYGFGGFGVANQQFSNRADFNEEIGFLWESFPTASAGMHVNFNPIVWQSAVGIDQPFSYTKYFIGLEGGITRNFYTHMEQYRSMLFVSLQIGFVFNKAKLRPNSALR